MPLIGRHKTPCISCGFAAPHVKRNEGKLPYVHCPECGLMCAAKNGTQARGLMANMRPETGAIPEPPATDNPIIVKADPAPAAAPVKPASQVTPPPPAPRPAASPFATLLDHLKK
ncbi:MAG: hypothetical protein ACK4S6_16225 [Roseateles asaccharophilus]|uniref:hypothetical protein n=1 Tax=Roseateles asaccharophilus TaxID=582607 RepID=UPI00391DAB02